jgi:hypothetical protein
MRQLIARNHGPVRGEPHSAFSYPETIYPSVASLVPIALFAAAPFSASQAYRRATSNSMTRFSGVASILYRSPKTVCRRRHPCELTEPNATPLRCADACAPIAARSTPMIQIWTLRSRLEKQPTDRREPRPAKPRKKRSYWLLHLSALRLRKHKNHYVSDE